MNRFSRLFKTALFIGSFPFIACCSSAKFIPLPPKVISGIYHPVGKGETLWRICKTYNADLQEVAELNSIKDASQIKVGDKLFIPGAKNNLGTEHRVGTVPMMSWYGNRLSFQNTGHH